MQRQQARYDANKTLLRSPNINKSDSLETVLRYYFNDYWFYNHTVLGKTNEFIFNYLATIFDNKEFDFKKYSVKGSVGNKNKIYPFIEIEKDHKKCCEKIYFERIYTKFSSSVFTYKGKVYSFLKFFITHNDILKKMKDYDSGRERVLNKIAENIDNCEITEEQHNAINNAFESFIAYFGKLSIYSYDEIVFGNHSVVNLLISLFLEFFIVMNDEKRINKLFEFFHNTGNVKAEAFTKLLKEEEGRSEDAEGEYRERPISDFIRARYGYGSDFGLSLSELYYFINFYKTFKNGKFLNSILNGKPLLMNYITTFKNESGYRIKDNAGRLDKKFFTLFNSIKPNDVYSLETFERFNTLIINKITGTKVLDILEQDASTLQMCLTDPDLEHSVPSFYFSGYRTYYNFLAYIEYNKLSDQQKQRYWKMISNFINTTTLKSKRLLKILSNLANLHEMTEAELVSNLQPYVLASKQTLLLELYLD